MRVIVAGSRNVSESEVNNALSSCSWKGFITAVVSGGARGADTFGEHWAKANSIEIIKYPANWEKYGKKAGPLRNEEMAKNAEGLVAVWDGKSRGTKSMISLALKYGLRISILRTDTGRVESFEPTGDIASLWDIVEERASHYEYDAGMNRIDAESLAIKSVLENTSSVKD